MEEMAGLGLKDKQALVKGRERWKIVPGRGLQWRGQGPIQVRGLARRLGQLESKERS